MYPFASYVSSLIPSFYVGQQANLSILQVIFRFSIPSSSAFTPQAK